MRKGIVLLMLSVFILAIGTLAWAGSAVCEISLNKNQIQKVKAEPNAGFVKINLTNNQITKIKSTFPKCTKTYAKVNKQHIYDGNKVKLGLENGDLVSINPLPTP